MICEDGDLGEADWNRGSTGEQGLSAWQISKRRRRNSVAVRT